MKAKHVAVIAGLLLAVGLFVGFAPVSSGGVACGSAFSPSRDALRSDFINAGYGRSTNARGGCEATRSAMRIPAILLTALGGIGLLGGLIAASSGTRGDGNSLKTRHFGTT